VSYFTEEIPDSVIEDLRSLFQGFLTTFVDSTLINEDAIISYHLIFGRLTLAVGGADADLFVDGTMYEKLLELEVHHRPSLFEGYKG